MKPCTYGTLPIGFARDAPQDRSWMNLTNQDYSRLQCQIRWSHISLASLILHQDATCRAQHGSNLTACSRDTAGLMQISTEWDWLIIKTACAATSHPPVTSSITVLSWPLHAVSPTPPTKTWLNIFSILPVRLTAYYLSAMCIRQKTKMSWEQNKRCSNVICFQWHDLMFVYSCS